MEQDGEVSDLVRDLVEDDGQRRGDADGNTREETRRDHDAIDEIVHALSRRAHDADAVMMVGALFGWERVAMSPMYDFFDDEGEDDAAEENVEALAEGRGSLRQVGHDVDEHVSEQAARREADEVEQGFFDEGSFEEEERDAKKREKAHEDDAYKGVGRNGAHGGTINESQNLSRIPE